jgi:undecaprenyl phosphate-alpha-L-ara4N flippase subunit ArnF
VVEVYGVFVRVYREIGAYKTVKYLYIASTILFTVYGQMILKWRIINLNWAMTNGNAVAKVKCYLELLFDPFVLSGFVSAFVASICWVMALSKFEITAAYPFMSLSPAIVFVVGILVFNETFTVGKVVGLVLIILGLIATVKL